MVELGEGMLDGWVVLGIPGLRCGWVGRRVVGLVPYEKQMAMWMSVDVRCPVEWTPPKW
jgi:hypothetical protein